MSAPAACVSCCVPATASSLEGELLEAPMGVHADLGGHLGPGAVRTELPRQRVVLPVDIEDALQAVDELLVRDGSQGLDAAVEVAGHEVGRADVVLAPAALAEPVDARVFEVTADDRPDGDVLGQPGHPRT